MGTPIPIILSPILTCTPTAKKSASDIKYKLFNTPEEAFRYILDSNPSIIGIGEYHDVKGNPNIESVTSRFLRLFPVLNGKITDMVVESLVTNGNCETTISAVTDGIQSATQRPPSSVNFVNQLIAAALNLNVTIHPLNLTCDDMKLLLKSDASTDYDKLLTMIRDHTLKKVQELFKLGKRITIYGGALHNDLQPKAKHKSYSFGLDLCKLSHGKYTEIDLAVPEYLDNIPSLSKERWYQIYRSHVSCTKTLLIMPNPNSFILVFPRSNCPSTPR